MVYVTSDIHGNIERYKKLLSIINLTPKDCLYILGDVVDRGESSIEILLDIMSRENVFMLMGNHEQMALDCLEALSAEITENSIRELSNNNSEMIMQWVGENGGVSTLNEFIKLSHDERAEVLDFIGCLPTFEEVTINGKQFILVHTGFGEDFSPDKPLDDYYDEDLLWTRLDYTRTYYPEKIVVSGHTPTQAIQGNENPGYIYKENNHIALDCGCASQGGRLGCICLNTMEEFYAE